MNCDFHLGKNDEDQPIIVRLKASLSDRWFEFEEQDRLLSFHSRLSLLPPSRRIYRRIRMLKNVFVKENILKFYYDSNQRIFKFNGRALGHYVPRSLAREPARRDADDSSLNQLRRLKFDPMHHNVSFFLFQFKNLTRNLSPSVQKFHLSKIVPQSDLQLIGDFQSAEIETIFKSIYLLYAGRQDPHLFRLESLTVEGDDWIGFVDKNLQLLDKLFICVSERQKIRFVIERFPASLREAFESDYVNANVFNYRRKFLNFLNGYLAINNVIPD